MVSIEFKCCHITAGNPRWWTSTVIRDTEHEGKAGVVIKPVDFVESRALKEVRARPRKLTLGHGYPLNLGLVLAETICI